MEWRKGKLVRLSLGQEIALSLLNTAVDTLLGHAGKCASQFNRTAVCRVIRYLGDGYVIHV